MCSPSTEKSNRCRIEPRSHLSARSFTRITKKDPVDCSHPRARPRCLDEGPSRTNAPIGRSRTRHAAPDELVQFLETGVRHEAAVWVSIPGNQQRNPMLCVPLKKKDRLLCGCSEEIAGFEAEAERGPGDLGDEQVALSEPVHIARKYLLRRHAPVSRPSVLAHQVAGEDLVPRDWRTSRIFFAASIEERLPATVKPK